jgi:hypothetical protein
MQAIRDSNIPSSQCSPAGAYFRCHASGATTKLGGKAPYKTRGWTAPATPDGDPCQPSAPTASWHSAAGANRKQLAMQQLHLPKRHAAHVQAEPGGLPGVATASRKRPACCTRMHGQEITALPGLDPATLASQQGHAWSHPAEQRPAQTCGPSCWAPLPQTGCRLLPTPVKTEPISHDD